jgi:hypothetical protein
MKATINPLTPQQNRHLYWLFGQLGVKDKDAIADIIWDHTNHRTHHTSELGFIECMELIKSLNNLLKNPRKTASERIDLMPEGSPERAELDRKRKGVIKAIFRYGELQGYQYTMEYVKGIACRAAGVERFNDISPEALTRIYHEFCKRQRTIATKNEMYEPFCMN